MQETLNLILSEIREVKEGQKFLQNEIREVKTKVDNLEKELKADIKEIRSDIKEIRLDIKELGFKMNDGHKLILKEVNGERLRVDMLSSAVRANSAVSRSLQERVEYLEEKAS